MRQKIKAVIALGLLSPVLAELLSGSAPASVFFDPFFFVLQVVSYGIPALIMRELAVKWKLGVSGLFVLGLGYGIFNEGLLANTFFSEDASFFKGYGFYLGLNLAWVPFAAIWHSLHAILYPTMLVHFLYPDVAQQRWLSGRMVKLLFVIALLESGLLYFAPHKNFQGTYFFVFWLAIFILAFLSKRFTAPVEYKSLTSYKGAFFLGFFTVPLYVILIALTKTQLPLFIYWIVLIGLVLVLWRRLKKKEWVTVPALIVFLSGDYIGNGIFAVLGRRSFEVLLTSIAITSFLLYLVRKSRLRTAASNVIPPSIDRDASLPL